MVEVHISAELQTRLLAHCGQTLWNTIQLLTIGSFVADWLAMLISKDQIAFAEAKPARDLP